MVVLDDEDHVEARQDGGHEVDVVLPLGVIPAAKHWVGGGQHGAARVQCGGDSSLGVWRQCQCGSVSSSKDSVTRLLFSLRTLLKDTHTKKKKGKTVLWKTFTLETSKYYHNLCQTKISANQLFLHLMKTSEISPFQLKSFQWSTTIHFLTHHEFNLNESALVFKSLEQGCISALNYTITSLMKIKVKTNTK